MRVGLWGARADRRGLAIQTTEWARHMHPHRIAGMDLTAEGRSSYPCDWSDYTGLPLEVFEPLSVDDDTVRRWLDGLDVVFGCETFYHDRFILLAREVGVATVLQANPEFYPHRLNDLPRPTVLTTPTSWLADRMEGATVLPTPVDRGRCAYHPRPQGEAVTFLHVAGHRAARDRAGTAALMRALPLLRRASRIVIRSQSPLRIQHPPRNLHLDVRVENIDRYWDLYTDGDVLVHPRRYGGQSLPAQEAASCGLPVLMTDTAPQRDWLPPDLLVPATHRRSFRSQNGKIPVMDPNPHELAARMDALTDPQRVAELSAEMDRWAQACSWGALEEAYWALLEDACRVSSAR